MLSQASLPSSERTPITDKDLYIASHNDSLGDFLKKELSQGRHIYCSFTKAQLHGSLRRELKKREIQSISFIDGYTIYPCHEY